jgi:hypothetical protein
VSSHNSLIWFSFFLALFYYFSLVQTKREDRSQNKTVLIFGSLQTKGFNCADLKNLANEAALRATREVIAKQKQKQKPIYSSDNDDDTEQTLRNTEVNSSLSKIIEMDNEHDKNAQCEEPPRVIQEKHIQEAFLTLYYCLHSPSSFRFYISLIYVLKED